MKTLTKLLTGTALATLTFNSYSQTPKHIMIAYVSIQDKKDEIILNVDSAKFYSFSFTIDKARALDIMMGEKSKENKLDTKNKLYLVKKTKKETIIVPTIIEGGYDFSKDSKKDIEKEVKKLIKDEKISISDVVKYGSEEMFIELVGEEKE